MMKAGPVFWAMFLPPLGVPPGVDLWGHGALVPAELPGMFPAAHNAVSFCVFIGCLYMLLREMSFALKRFGLFIFHYY